MDKTKYVIKDRSFIFIGESNIEHRILKIAFRNKNSSEEKNNGPKMRSDAFIFTKSAIRVPRYSSVQMCAGVRLLSTGII